MRTTVTIDDALYQEALQMSEPGMDKADLIREAIKTFVRVQAAKRLAALGSTQADMPDYTVIARRDAPDAVVMSLETFNSLMETVHLLKSPANAAHLASSIAQYRQGQVMQRDLADAN